VYNLEISSLGGSRHKSALLTSTLTQTSPLLDHHFSRSRSRSPSTPPRSPFHSLFGDGAPLSLWDPRLNLGSRNPQGPKMAGRRRARLFQCHCLTGPPCTKRHLPLRPPAEEFSRILLSLRDVSCPRILPLLYVMTLVMLTQWLISPSGPSHPVAHPVAHSIVWAMRVRGPSQ